MIYLNLVILCALFTVICYLGTGTDVKNMKSFRNYPEKIKERVRKNPALSPMINEVPAWQVWVSNLITFLIIFFLLGLDMKTPGFWHNFLMLTILGQVFNVYDLVVLDFLWWRNSKRVVLSGTEDLRKDYLDMHNHIASFLRAIPMFLIVAAVDGWILTLF